MKLYEIHALIGFNQHFNFLKHHLGYLHHHFNGYTKIQEVLGYHPINIDPPSLKPFFSPFVKFRY